MYSEHYDFAVSLTPCEWDQYMLLIDAWLYILRKFRSKSFIQMKPICHLQSSISSFFSIVLIHSRFMSYYVALFLGFHISSSTFVIVYAPWFVFFFLSLFLPSCQASYRPTRIVYVIFQIIHNLHFCVYWIPCQIEWLQALWAHNVKSFYIRHSSSLHHVLSHIDCFNQIGNSSFWEIERRRRMNEKEKKNNNGSFIIIIVIT